MRGNTCGADYSQLAVDIKTWGIELGFQQVAITNTNLEQAEHYLKNWLDDDFHGDMGYMKKHGLKRSRPQDLIPGTRSIITARMDYYPEYFESSEKTLSNPEKGYISRYALGRDYHKVLRKRLQRLSEKIAGEIGVFGYRVFVDSGPVLEKALAEKAGLGWIGKHTNVINQRTGSWCFLGEIYTDLPLPIDSPVAKRCGTCQACIDICPTRAIVAPFRLDARRCISYLTIELSGSIPEELRPMMGNRIYGCDDCQLVCPWNRFAQLSKEPDFAPRHQLDSPKLIDLFSWDEQTFMKKTEGSAIRRIGFERWLRNVAVALGNAPTSSNIIAALEFRKSDPSEVIREHVLWALEQHGKSMPI